MKEQMGFHPSMPAYANKQTKIEKTQPRETSEIRNTSRPLDAMPIGMAYVPMQKWQKIYDDEIAFERGTIFQELDLPFIGEELPK